MQWSRVTGYLYHKTVHTEVKSEEKKSHSQLNFIPNFLNDVAEFRKLNVPSPCDYKPYNFTIVNKNVKI